jgi:hypothetical protein
MEESRFKPVYIFQPNNFDNFLLVEL